MFSRQIAENPKTFVVIFETGDELLTGLRTFAVKNKLSGSSFKAIGALSGATLGWFNWETKQYEVAVELNEQIELMSLIGDVVLENSEPRIHAHMIVGRRDGTAHGGHLIEARVRPTCELVLTESPVHLQKRIDPDSGLALIRF